MTASFPRGDSHSNDDNTHRSCSEELPANAHRCELIQSPTTLQLRALHALRSILQPGNRGRERQVTSTGHGLWMCGTFILSAKPRPLLFWLYDGKVGDWQAIQVSFWAERTGTLNVPKILVEKSNVILLAEGRTEIRICKCRINMVMELKSRTRKEVKNISACIMVVCHSRKLMETQRSRAGCSDRQDKNMSWILMQFWGFAFDLVTLCLKEAELYTPTHEQVSSGLSSTWLVNNLLLTWTVTWKALLPTNLISVECWWQNQELKGLKGFRSNWTRC